MTRPQSSASFVRIVATDGNSYPAALAPLSSDTGAVSAPLSGAAPTFPGDPPNFIELGYGTGPRCIDCRRNVSGCQCDAPEPEPEYFKPGINRDPDVWAGEDDGFVFVERIGPGRIAV